MRWEDVQKRFLDFEFWILDFRLLDFGFWILNFRRDTNNGVRNNLWSEGRGIARSLKSGDFEEAREQLSCLMNAFPHNGKRSLDYKRNFFKTFLTGVFLTFPTNGDENTTYFEDTMETCTLKLDQARSWRELKSCILKQFETVISIFTDFETRRRKIITEAHFFIEKHFKEVITLDDVLRHLQVSRSWFKESFKQEIGLTYTDYVRKRRVEEACYLLRASDHPMWIVAIESGLRTDRTMRRAFQEVLGTSPQDYRRNHSHKTCPCEVRERTKWHEILNKQNAANISQNIS